MPSDSASFRVGASWSPEMIAMCLMPRSRSPLTIVADLGPDRRLQLDGAANLVVDADHHHRVPFAMGLVQRLSHLARSWASPSSSMNRLLPTRIVRPSIVHGDAVADLVLGVVGRRQLEVQLLGLVQDRQGDGVVELLLGGRGVEQDLLGGVARGWR